MVKSSLDILLNVSFCIPQTKQGKSYRFWNTWRGEMFWSPLTSSGWVTTTAGIPSSGSYSQLLCVMKLSSSGFRSSWSDLLSFRICSGSGSWSFSAWSSPWPWPALDSSVKLVLVRWSWHLPLIPLEWDILTPRKCAGLILKCAMKMGWTHEPKKQTPEKK